jgi:plasmid stabilization system protein ParE
MQVFWSKSAKQVRYDIALYISQESVEAACAILDRFDQAARQLENFHCLPQKDEWKELVSLLSTNTTSLFMKS